MTEFLRVAMYVRENKIGKPNIDAATKEELDAFDAQSLVTGSQWGGGGSPPR